MKTILRSLLVVGLGLIADAAAAQHFLVRPTTVAQLRQQAAAHAPAAARRSPGTTVLRPGQVMTYGYDDIASAWVEPKRNLFRYDGLGRATQQTESDSATGKLLNRTLTTYNAAGQLTETRIQHNTGGVLLDSAREVFTFDAQRQLTEHQEQTIDAANAWQTNRGERYFNTYNPGNQLTAQTFQVFDNFTNAYADSARYLFTLLPTGEWTERVGQRPDGTGGWTNNERLINAVWFNFGQQQMTSADIQLWTGTQWQTNGRLRGTYSATAYEVIQQDLVGDTWVNASRVLVSYDAYANLLDASLAGWDGTAWDIGFEVRNQYTYNPDQTLRRNVVSANFFGGGLDFIELSNYSNYQSIVLGSRATSAAPAPPAYPNPSADGRFTLLLPAAAAAGQVLAFDALGREVARLAWTASPRRTLTLDLAGQPAGLYTVVVQTEAGRSTQRVSIR